MSRPRLLDLFCGAGGAAVGYDRAGFEVVGVDIKPQPHYPYTFVQMDALDYAEGGVEGFDIIHASPPCQAHSTLRHRTGREYQDLIAPTRLLLERSRKPYVIENVAGAPLFDPMLLCGSMFGLAVRRHRLFESRLWVSPPGPCRHALQPEPIDVTGTGGRSSKPRLSGGGLSRKPRNLTDARAAMDMPWATRRELSQAIPPAYTEHIGRQLIAALGNAA